MENPNFRVSDASEPSEHKKIKKYVKNIKKTPITNNIE
jgi:hypothetical protein